MASYRSCCAAQQITLSMQDANIQAGENTSTCRMTIHAQDPPRDQPHSKVQMLTTSSRQTTMCKVAISQTQTHT
jgi:hypothetical protein